MPAAGVVFAPVGAAAPPRLDTKAIDSAFAAYTRGVSPGCAAGIVREGHLVWSKGYGYASLEQRVPITRETLFDLGSTSKQITAAVVALLAKEGRLSLDDDVRRFIPELPDYGHTITLRHLLTHTSGLRDYTDLLSLAGHHEADLTTTAEGLALLARQRGVNFVPGAAYRYCNSGFFLLAVVVERVTGKSLRAVAQERIFAPLGMTHTTYLDDHALVVPGRATGYTSRPEGGFATEMSDWEQVGDGGVQSSIAEMARWAALFDGDGAGAPLPAAWLRDTLETPGRLADGTVLGYGLGLGLETHRTLRVVEHGGAWAGYRAMLMRIPQWRAAAIVLCNTADADTHALAYVLADAAINGFPKPAPTAPAPAAAATVKATDAISRDQEPRFECGTGWIRPPADEVGTYYNEALGEVLTVREQAGTIYADAIDAAAPLVPNGALGYLGRRWKVLLTFAQDHSGVDVADPDEADPRPVRYQRAAHPGPRAAGGIDGIEGDYRSEEIGATWTVSRRAGVAHVALPGGEGFDLEPLAPDLFQSDWGMVRLSRDAAGRPVALALTNRGLVGLRVTRVAADAVCR
jgi:CubicO group peptidase (beta-lactamase class C family)